MLYVDLFSDKELIKACHDFRLPFEFSKTGINSYEDLLDYAINNTRRFFPRDFIRFYEATDALDKFNEETKSYLKMITAIRFKLSRIEKIIVKHSKNKVNKKQVAHHLCFKSINDYIHNLKQYKENPLIDASSVFRKIKRLSVENSNFDEIFQPYQKIVKWQEEYLCYSLDHLNDRPSVYKNKDSRKCKYRYIKNFVSEFMEDIEHSGEPNVWISEYLIERDYNYKLICELSRLFHDRGININNCIVESCLHLCLLPNAINRGEYADTIISIFKKCIQNRTLDYNGNSYGTYNKMSFIFSEEDFIKQLQSKMTKMIVQISKISFPLMEKYVWYIINLLESSNSVTDRRVCREITNNIKYYEGQSTGSVLELTDKEVTMFNKIAPKMYAYWNNVQKTTKDNVTDDLLVELDEENYYKFLDEEIMQIVSRIVEK